MVVLGLAMQQFDYLHCSVSETNFWRKFDSFVAEINKLTTVTSSDKFQSSPREPLSAWHHASAQVISIQALGRWSQPARTGQLAQARLQGQPHHPDPPARVCQSSDPDRPRTDRSETHEDVFRQAGARLALRVPVHRPHQEEGRLLGPLPGPGAKAGNLNHLLGWPTWREFSLRRLSLPSNRCLIISSCF